MMGDVNSIRIAGDVGVRRGLASKGIFGGLDKWGSDVVYSIVLVEMLSRLGVGSVS